MTSALGRHIAAMRLARLDDHSVALWLFLACTALYLPTLSPSVVAGDGGEFQMVSQKLAVAHPTGYPLLMLAGWLFGHLPLGGDAAWRVTLSCTLATAATVALLYLLLRELGAGVWPALAAALLAASASRVWLYATITESVALTDLFMVLEWWLLIRWAMNKTPLWAPALVFGLGLTHHISMRLLALPVLIFIVAVEPSIIVRPRRWLLPLVCLLLPLTLYAYVPLRAAYFAGLPELQGDILGVRKTIASGLISPHYYVGGSLGLIVALDHSRQFLLNSGANWSWAIRQFADMLRQQFPLPVIIPLVLAGVAVLFHRQTKASILLLISFGLILLSAVSYLARVGEDGKHFVPAYLLMAIWFGMGIEAIRAWAESRRAPLPVFGIMIMVGLLAIIAVNGATHFAQAMRDRQPDWSRALFDQPLPAGAVITGEWSLITPLRYHQQVDHLRPDLWFIHADTPGTALLMQRALTQGVPFYTLRQTGAGVRLLPLPAPGGQVITHPADVGLGTIVRWRGFDLDPVSPMPGVELQLTLYWQPVAQFDRNWKTFIHLLDEHGEKVAQADRVPLDGLYPPIAWQPGLLLADQYELKLPSGLRPGRYRLVFGWYDGAERLTWQDGGNSHPLTEITIR